MESTMNGSLNLGSSTQEGDAAPTKSEERGDDEQPGDGTTSGRREVSDPLRKVQQVFLQLGSLVANRVLSHCNRVEEPSFSNHELKLLLDHVLSTTIFCPNPKKPFDELTDEQRAEVKQLLYTIYTSSSSLTGSDQSSPSSSNPLSDFLQSYPDECRIELNPGKRFSTPFPFTLDGFTEICKSVRADHSRKYLLRINDPVQQLGLIAKCVRRYCCALTNSNEAEIGEIPSSIPLEDLSAIFKGITCNVNKGLVFGECIGTAIQTGFMSFDKNLPGPVVYSLHPLAFRASLHGFTVDGHGHHPASHIFTWFKIFLVTVCRWRVALGDTGPLSFSNEDISHLLMKSSLLMFFEKERKQALEALLCSPSTTSSSSSFFVEESTQRHIEPRFQVLKGSNKDASSFFVNEAALSFRFSRNACGAVQKTAQTATAGAKPEDILETLSSLLIKGGCPKPAHDTPYHEGKSNPQSRSLIERVIGVFSSVTAVTFSDLQNLNLLTSYHGCFGNPLGTLFAQLCYLPYPNCEFDALLAAPSKKKAGQLNEKLAPKSIGALRSFLASTSRNYCCTSSDLHKLVSSTLLEIKDISVDERSNQKIWKLSQRNKKVVEKVVFILRESCFSYRKGSASGKREAQFVLKPRWASANYKVSKFSETLNQLIVASTPSTNNHPAIIQSNVATATVEHTSTAVMPHSTSGGTTAPQASLMPSSTEFRGLPIGQTLVSKELHQRGGGDPAAAAAQASLSVPNVVNIAPPTAQTMPVLQPPATVEAANGLLAASVEVSSSMTNYIQKVTMSGFTYKTVYYNQPLSANGSGGGSDNGTTEGSQKLHAIYKDLVAAKLGLLQELV